MGQHIAHEVHPTALPGGAEDLLHGRLDAFMGIGDDQLDAAQAAPGELAQEGGPEGLGFRRADLKPMALTRSSTERVEMPWI
jgi:hypothetical protein